jgi:Ala-tRNA(Pro) deacylase
VGEITGLAPGSIPPFASLFKLPTWCDQRLSEQERINFNAGDHAISLSMTFEDYRAVEAPMLGTFALEEEAGSATSSNRDGGN